MKYFSMFSGIGGFELGIQRALHNKYVAKKQQNRKRWDRNINEQQNSILPTNNTALCVGYSEIDKYAIETYNKHFGGHKNYGDATKISTEKLPNFDLLVGGFPCQTFSIAGKRRGFEDTRGTLFFDIARILKAKQPKMFLLENVKGLLNHDGGNTFTKILQTIDELGYDAEWQVLNSKYFGVPQNRERVFIIGHLRRSSRKQVFPVTSKYKSIINKNSQICQCHTARYYKGGNGSHVKAIDVYNKKLRNECPTLTEPHHNSIRLTDGLNVRKLTPIECEKLQGFPINWTIGISDTQRYKQLGNAVTVNVIETIMNKILK